MGNVDKSPDFAAAGGIFACETVRFQVEMMEQFERQSGPLAGCAVAGKRRCGKRAPAVRGNFIVFAGKRLTERAPREYISPLRKAKIKNRWMMWFAQCSSYLR
jgi:hypothetical protein